MKRFLITLIFAFIGLFAAAQTADELFDAKEWNRALNAYYYIYRAEPNNLKALRRIGYIYYLGTTTSPQAEEFFGKALKVDPNDPVSNYYMGLLNKERLQQDLIPGVRINRTQKAKFYLEKALALGCTEAKEELETLK